MTVALLATLLAGGLVAMAADRDTTREEVRSTLETGGQLSDVNVSFRQSSKNPYNFVGSMTSGLKNADSLEIVVSITKSDTIGFRIYPHYKAAYINLQRARDQRGLMRKLLYYSDQNFLFWGADDTADVFCGYTVTLESGFPKEAIFVILRSIHNTDRFVGELRPFIDNSAAL
ncbi:MAG: hypothetical protein NVSMB31_02500 [Vulcanimicrobiaceae bacterium]